MDELIGITLRVSVMYVFALTVMRLAGKRTFNSLSPLDFLMAQAIGDMFDDVFWAEVPLAQGLVGFGTMVLLHSLVSLATWRSQKVHDLTTGRPALIMDNGMFIDENLAKERLRREDVVEILRARGEDKLEELQQVTLEPSGKLGILKHRLARPAQKSDVPQLQGGRA